MGQAKKAWQEQQELGYSTITGDKHVCANCFDDYALQEFVTAHVESKSCSYCGASAKRAIAAPINEVLHFVAEGINYEWEDPVNSVGWSSSEGGWLHPGVVDSFDLLHNVGLVCKTGDLFTDLACALGDQQWCRHHPYDVEENERFVDGWEHFKELVMHRSRYFFVQSLESSPEEYQYPETNPVEILNVIQQAVVELDLIKPLPVGTPLHRVRIVSREEDPKSAEQLGTPPIEFTLFANRMSPAGIPMFYGAFELETAIGETYVRRDGSPPRCVAGEFITLRDLTVLDLSDTPSVPSLFDVERRRLRSAVSFLVEFIEDFSKPIEKGDKAHVDYVPTQVVTEYFRDVYGSTDEDRLDGIVYRSARNEGGKAIVLFVSNEQCVDRGTHSDGAVLELQNVTHPPLLG